MICSAMLRSSPLVTVVEVFSSGGAEREAIQLMEPHDTQPKQRAVSHVRVEKKTSFLNGFVSSHIIQGD